MRLFVAILLTEPMKDALCEIGRELAPQLLRGRLSRRENLHLTLAFLGETPGFDRAAAALQRICAPPFEIATGRAGRFRRSGGDVAWVEIRENPALAALQRQVADSLRREGFPLENRPFRPHLTLGREVALPEGFDFDAFSRRFSPCGMTVRAVSLMQSHRTDGRLIYTELTRRTLQ